MKNSHEHDTPTYYLPLFMSIGISVGVAIGAATNNIPIGMSIGVGIGMCTGAILDARNRQKNNDAVQENDKEDSDTPTE